VRQAHRKISGKIVIATHNPGKLREMSELLSIYGIEAVSAGELGLGEPEEPGRPLRKMRASNPTLRPRPRGSPLSPTIQALWLMRSAARPEFIPRAGPDQTRISHTP
jgi:hypothetical protein